MLQSDRERALARELATLTEIYRVACKQREALAAQVKSSNALMSELLNQLGERDHENGNAPGHAHEIPGVWDDDNGELAGKPCAWCETWAHAKAPRSTEPSFNEAHGGNHG